VFLLFQTKAIHRHQDMEETVFTSISVGNQEEVQSVFLAAGRPLGSTTQREALLQSETPSTYSLVSPRWNLRRRHQPIQIIGK
jgi:hypothetical protein